MNPLLRGKGGGEWLIHNYFKPIFFGGGRRLNRDWGRRWGDLFNLETSMVSVLHKELEYKVEKLKYKKFEVMQPRIRIKSGNF